MSVLIVNLFNKCVHFYKYNAPEEDENDGYEAEEEKRTAWEIIRELEKKYKEDDEAMGDIERLKEDIKYLEDMEKDPNYDGTTPLGLALDLEAVLETWN